jgi:hypothetical protein
VLSMKLQVGDRLADETAVWEIIGRAVHDEHGEKTPTFACAAPTSPASPTSGRGAHMSASA